MKTMPQRKASDNKSSDSGQMARSAGVVGLYTLASRFLGLIRDAVVAAWFQKRATDAFFVAYTIPNVLRRLLAEGSLTVAFIPVFTEYRQKRSEAEARAMLSNMLGATITVLSLVVGVGILVAPWVVRLFAYGLTADPAKFELAVLLTRIMFFFLLGVGLTALAMGVLNTLRHFTAPALAPVVLNIFIISTVLGAGPLMTRLNLPPITALSCGVVLGGLAQVLLQMPFLARHKMMVWPRLGFTDPGVLRVAKLMLPSVFGLAIYEVNVILARQFASYLPEGSISYLYYAARLVEFPMGIFAVAMATVAMPSLSSHASAGQLDQLKQTYRYALRVVFFIILPASVGLGALAVPISSVLFQRGQFSHAMAVETAVTLMGFLGGLWAGAGVRQTVPVFYAMQDTRTPVKVAMASLVVYGAAAFLLFKPLQTLGLSLSVACSSVVNFLLLLYLLRRKLGPLGMGRVVSSAVRSGLAALGCGAGAWYVASLVDWTGGGRSPKSFGLLLLAVLAGVMVYLLLCKLLRIRELNDVISAFLRRGRSKRSKD